MHSSCGSSASPPLPPATVTEDGPRSDPNAATLQHLPEDLLIQHLKPVCSLPSRLSMLQASSCLDRVVRAGLPRQTRVCSDNDKPVTCSRAPVMRLSTEAPCVEEYLAPVHMRLDATSEITVELNNSTRTRMQEVSQRVNDVVARMHRVDAQPTRVLRVLCTYLPSGRRARELLRGLTMGVRESLHTVIVRHGSVELPPIETLFPFFMSPCFPNVTTVDLCKTATDILGMVAAFPQLTSLRMTQCEAVQDWPGLVGLTGLRDLRLNMYEVGGHAAALAAVAEMTWLTSVSLPEFGTAACVALLGYTRLTSLCLSTRNMHASDTAVLQASLDVVASRNPGVLRLGLAVLPDIVVPSAWTRLEEVVVSHGTVLPPLPSIRSLVTENSDIIYPNRGLWTLPVPPKLRSLRVAYDELPNALGCRDLEVLCWTPVALDRLFPLSAHVALLGALTSATQDVWPLLERVLVVQGRLDSAPKEIRDVEIIYSSQMLQLLASARRVPCAITHVTLQQSEPGAGTFDALCRMPRLCSVTLIGMHVNVTRLRSIVRLPTMRLLELVGVTGVDEAQLDRVARDHVGRVTLQVLPLAQMDARASGAFDWEF